MKFCCLRCYLIRNLVYRILVKTKLLELSVMNRFIIQENLIQYIIKHHQCVIGHA